MPTYFYGWRRKAGCFSLVMACVFNAGWLRSLCGVYWLRLSMSGYQLLFISFNGSIHCSRDLTANVLDKSRMLDWHFGSDLPYLDQMATEGILNVYYSLFVIPLTLLSAWLLMSKPRAPKHANHPDETRTSS